MPKAFKPADLAEVSLFTYLTPEPIPARAAEGHRNRMRQRLLKAGPNALADHEMLEMILFIALPRRDTKPIARDLLARFRTFGAVIGAPAPELMAVEGLGEAGAAALKLVQAAALRMTWQGIVEQPVLAVWDTLLDYLNAAMAHEPKEQFRVLFLDNRNRLIADEVQHTGTIDRTAAYPREIVKRCLELHASAVVLAHNHPSGVPTPSREDIEMTREITRAAATLGIKVHDHVIIGKGRHLSFKTECLL